MPVAAEPLLGYHPCTTGLLTSRREPAVGQCQTGSLTGAVASERILPAESVVASRNDVYAALKKEFRALRRNPIAVG